MSTTVPYPTTILPAPNFSFNISQGSGVIRTKLQRGRPTQRRVQTKAITLVNASWTFDEREILLFRSWFNDELELGSKWFLIPLKLGAITKTFKMRFTSGFNSGHKPVNNWEVQAALEIHDMQDCSFEEVEAAIVYFLESPTVPFYGGLFDARMEAIEITTNTTFVDTHSNKFIRVNSNNDIVLTLALNPPSFTNEWFCVISRVGAGGVEFVPEAGVIVDSDLGMKKISGLNTVVVIHYVSNNKFHIYGDLQS